MWRSGEERTRKALSGEQNHLLTAPFGTPRDGGALSQEETLGEGSQWKFVWIDSGAMDLATRVPFPTR